MPTGSAITAPIATDSNEICACCSVRIGMPSSPVQWLGSRSQSRTLIRNDTSAPRPGNGEPLHAGQRQVSQQREQDREQRADQQGRAKVVYQPFEDELPKAAQADDRGDGDESD